MWITTIHPKLMDDIQHPNSERNQHQLVMALAGSQSLVALDPLPWEWVPIAESREP